jgi:hypothetical protein
MQDFRKLKVWQKSHALTLEIYRATETFPGNELYGLTSQIRRSCVSIPANIAEGCGRNSDPELGKDLGFIGQANYEKLDKGTTEIKQMLTNLIINNFRL